MLGRVFVYCFYGIGNIILKLPMLKALHEMGYVVDAISDTKCINILKNEEYINILDVIDYKVKYDYVIMSLPNHNVGSYKRLKGQFINYSFDRGKQLKMLTKTHELVANMNLLKSLGYKGETPELKLTVDQGSIIKVKKYVDLGMKNVVLHNGSLPKNLNKRLSRSKMLMLICILLQQNYNVLLIGGKSERDYKDINTSGMINLVDMLRLEETTALISLCDCMISSDSGPMHIASAVGTPVVSYFGPTIVAKNYPWGNKEHVVTADVSCRPCYWTPKNKTCKRFDCMDEIELTDIVDKVKEIVDDKKI